MARLQVKPLAKWVEKDSLEDTVKGIEDFNPFQASYAEGATVKYTLDNLLRLFVARKELVKATVPRATMPAPTGLATDDNWREINPAGQTKIRDWKTGSYKKDEVVVWNTQLLRAKRDIADSISTIAADEVPSTGDWEVIAGEDTMSEPYQYDDTRIRTELSSVEQRVSQAEEYTQFLDSSLNARIDDIVSTAQEWLAGSYVKGEFARNGAGVFIAKQNIQNSTVAPTATNLYWLQVNGSAAIADGSITEIMLDADLLAKVNSAGDVTQSYVDAQDATLQNQITQHYATFSNADSGLQTQINGIKANPLPRVYATNLSGGVYQGSSLSGALGFTGIFGNILLFYPFTLTQDAFLAAGTHLVGNNFIQSLGGFRLNTREYSRVSNLIAQDGSIGIVVLGGTVYNNCFFSNVYFDVPAGKSVTLLDCDFGAGSGFVLFRGGGTVYLKGTSKVPDGAVVEAGTTVVVESSTAMPSGPAATPAPTNPIQNDTLDTFDYALPAGYIQSDIQQTLDGGATWTSATKPVQVGNINAPVNRVGVRTRAIGANPASSVLWNTAVYTQVGGAPIGIIPQDEANFNTQGGWSNLGGWTIEPTQIRANGGMGYYLRHFNAVGTGVVKVMIGEITGTAPLRLVTNTGFDVYPNTAGLHEFPITFAGANGNDTMHIGGQGGFVGTVDWIQIIVN